MPFDPTKPTPGDDLDAVLIRNQLNALKALIDAQAAQIAAQAAQIADLQAQITAAIAGSSSNTNAVATLNLTIGNSPTQNYDVQPIADKLDELINAQRR